MNEASANGSPRTVPDATWQQHLARTRQPGGGGAGVCVKVEALTTGVYFGRRTWEQKEREVLTERQIAGVDRQAQRHSSSGSRRKNREGMRRGCEAEKALPFANQALVPPPILSEGWASLVHAFASLLPAAPWSLSTRSREPQRLFASIGCRTCA